MREIRGITLDHPEGPRRVQLTTRDESGEDYETLIFPADLQLTRVQILTFLGEYYNMEPGQIIWPRHLKIPEPEGGEE